MAQTKRKIEASTIDEVYKEISRLQRLHDKQGMAKELGVSGTVLIGYKMHAYI